MRTENRDLSVFSGKLCRRDLLRLGSVVLAGSAAAGVLAACGGSAAAPASPASASPAGSTAAASSAKPAGSTAVTASAKPAGSSAAAASAKPAGSGAASAKPAASGAALADQLYAAAKGEGKVAWWTTFNSTISQQMADAFQKAYPGVTVEFQSFSTTDDRTARAQAESQSGQVTVDALEFDAPSRDKYTSLKLVTDNTDLFLAAGAPKDSIINGAYSTEYLVSGVGYNTNAVKDADLPKTWDDLLDPKYKGQIAVESRVRPFVYATAFWGQDRVTTYLTKLKTQNPRIQAGEGAAANLMLAGEFNYYTGAFLGTTLDMKGKPWGFLPLDEVFTGQGYTNITLPPKPPHPNAGKLFLYWYATPEATQLRDQLRFRSDPRPGAGTGPSKFLEDHHIAVRIAGPEWDAQADDLAAKYLAILGAPSK